MGAFKYTARTASGEVVSGTVDASSNSDASRKVRGQQLVPLKIVAVKNVAARGGSGRVSAKDLQVFTRQFAVCIGSGVPVLQSLEAMNNTNRGGNLNVALTDIIEQVGKGERLAKALARHPRVFDRMYLSLVSAGEESGALEAALNRLATYIEKSVYLRRKVVGALWYPVAVLIISAIVVAVLLIFVVPTFQKMFSEAGLDLPGLTQMVIDLSEAFQQRWYYFVGGAIALPFVVKHIYRHEDGRKVIDAVLLRLPLFGQLITFSAVARFTRTLATLLKSGVSILEALDLALAAIGNYHITKDLAVTREAVEKGVNLSTPLQSSKYVPVMATQMIAIGEQTGDLDAMLERAGVFFEDEVEVKANAMITLIEPMLMVFLGLIIGTLVIALYLPIFQMAAAASA